jgi:hypothetical protein
VSDFTSLPRIVRATFSMSGHDAASASLPRVSIVTVTLNNRAFIEEAMQSVFAQSYPNIEYLSSTQGDQLRGTS